MLATHFGAGLLRVRIEKYRVITKPATAATFAKYAASPDFLDDERGVLLARPGERRGAVEATATPLVRDAFELFEQQIEILLVRRVLPGITGRSHARPSVQRVDDNARVICHCGQPRPLGSETRLQECVVGKRRARFFRRIYPEVGLGNDLYIQPGENTLDLADFARIAGCKNDSFHGRSARRIDRLRLSHNDLIDTFGRQAEQCIKLTAIECVALGSPLDFDKLAGIVHDNVHVRFRL